MTVVADTKSEAIENAKRRWNARTSRMTLDEAYSVAFKKISGMLPQQKTKEASE